MDFDVFGFNDVDDIDFDFDFDDDSFHSQEWFITPQKKLIEFPKYKKAVEMAKKITIDSDGDRRFCFIDGSFIMGDLVEAMFVENNWYTEKLTIATLSLSHENADSMLNLLKGGYVGSLTIIVSDYFFSHERGKNGLVPYLYEKYEKYDFQLVVIRSHCKIIFFKTDCGKHIVMHGSANLRSSDNIEQMMIENCIELYEHNSDVFLRIEETHKTVDKSLRGDRLWQVVAQEEEKPLI